MAVEIKELLIEINVVPDSNSDGGRRSAVSENQIQLLAEYAEQIMQQIDKQKER